MDYFDALKWGAIIGFGILFPIGFVILFVALIMIMAGG
jgi:hypothetical protein